MTLLNVLLIRFCKLLILAYGIRNRKCTKLWEYLTYNGYSIIGLAYYYIYSLSYTRKCWYYNISYRLCVIGIYKICLLYTSPSPRDA